MIRTRESNSVGNKNFESDQSDNGESYVDEDSRSWIFRVREESFEEG